MTACGEIRGAQDASVWQGDEQKKRVGNMVQEDNIVTGITGLSKGRYKIEIDGEVRFVLYRGELSACHVKEGERIPEEDLQEILSEILPKRAKLRSMNLLKSRTYTEHQLREKLKQGFYPEPVIDEAVEYVKSFHYIDDRRYVKDYIVYYSESRSRGRIVQDLIKKGIRRELINDVYDGDLEEELPEESALIEKWIRKKGYDRENADYKERQKMGAFLYRKGFSMDQIEKLI